jgi:protein-disulfide isomerase
MKRGSNLLISTTGKSTVVLVLSLTAVFLLAMDLLIFFGLAYQQSSQLNNSNTVATGSVATLDDPYMGSFNADVVIVEFTDFKCPYCLQAFPVILEVISTYGDKIKFIFRDFPDVGKYPEAQKAAEAANCAFDQGKYMEMHNKLFINQDNLSVPALKRYALELGLDTEKFDTCLDSNKYRDEALQDLNDGLAAGVAGTPTFFINDYKVEGVIPLDNFKRIIDQLLVYYQG